MSTMRRISAGLVILLGLAGSATAAEYIKLKNGTPLKGRATAYDAQRKVLSFRTEDGKDQTYTLDQLDQRSVYMVNSSLVPKDSGRGQLQLANYARDIGLFAHAKRRYEYAEKADPSLAAEVERERVIGRKLAADYCMKNAQDAVSKNNFKEAEKWLTTLVQKLPNEPQAEQAAKMIEQYYAKEHNRRDDELEKEHSELLQKDLKRGKQLYDQMIKRTQDGLTARNSSQAEKLWESAIKDGEEVLKEIDKLAKKFADDPKVQDGAAKYRELTKSQLVELHLHLASAHSVGSSYNAALKETNAALALDPKNAQALAQRARIEQASSEGIGIDLF